jgi:hypothetical protein
MFESSYPTTTLGLIETQKMNKNRDDLRDLCAGVVEILLLLRDEILIRGQVAGVRFIGLCEDFMR